MQETQDLLIKLNKLKDIHLFDSLFPWPTVEDMSIKAIKAKQSINEKITDLDKINKFLSRSFPPKIIHEVLSIYYPQLVAVPDLRNDKLFFVVNFPKDKHIESNKILDNIRQVLIDEKFIDNNEIFYLTISSFKNVERSWNLISKFCNIVGSNISIKNNGSLAYFLLPNDSDNILCVNRELRYYDGIIFNTELNLSKLFHGLFKPLVDEAKLSSDEAFKPFHADKPFPGDKPIEPLAKNKSNKDKNFVSPFDEAKPSSDEVFKPLSHSDWNSGTKNLAEDNKIQPPTNLFQNTNPTVLLDDKTLDLSTVNQSPKKENQPMPPKKNNIEDLLLNADKIRANLRALDAKILTDLPNNDGGHWDLFWPEDCVCDDPIKPDVSNTGNWTVRNPEKDIIKNSFVAIDFGTASTVIAYRVGTRTHLSPIGIDSNIQIKPEHYENPSLLSFANYTSFKNDWDSKPFRPNTKWEDVFCSHTSKSLIEIPIKENIQSTIDSLKTWARFIDDEGKYQIRDAKGSNFELDFPSKISTENIWENYVTDDLNPIEIYAYYLGLHLNNQITSPTIFTKYYLTFPERFNPDIKERIRASFQRGLERSLPASLGYAKKWREKANLKLEVKELISEPTAYAASALDELGLIPTENQPIFFGVFDFGGGTTDYSFGYYRQATEDEFDEHHWSYVLEMEDGNSEETLGGENLLHHMAYQLMLENKDKFILSTGKWIPMELPHGLDYDPSIKNLLDKSNVARTNKRKIMTELRPIWHEGKLPNEIVDAENIIHLDLLNNDGENESINLNINLDSMIKILKSRIDKGVYNFFTLLEKTFATLEGEQTINILLAGNSCRSEIVQKSFEEYTTKLSESGFQHKLTIHKPLEAKEGDLEAVTMKTGVAYGLLAAAAGDIGINNRFGEDPFRYKVGYYRFKKFKVVVQHDNENNEKGQWREFLKLPTSGYISVYYSDAPCVDETYPEDGEYMKCQTQYFGEENAGKQILIRVMGSSKIEFALVDDENKAFGNVTMNLSDKR